MPLAASLMTMLSDLATLSLMATRQYFGYCGSGTHITQACHLYVPTATSGTAGPDPLQNKTLVSLDRDRTLRLRVIQFGREVPSCDMDLKLE